MSLNIVLDNDIVLNLLSLSQNDIQRLFSRLQKSSVRFWIPSCSLSLLSSQMSPSRHRPLASLFGDFQPLSSLGIHWAEVPAKYSNKVQAVMSLDAATLPGKTIIWTGSSHFDCIPPDIEWGDDQFVFAILAEYESEQEDSIQLVDLNPQQLNIRSALEKKLYAVLKHGQYILGPEVQLLESQLAAWINVKHCITVANGTDALLLALMAIGVKPGDEVITTPFSFISAVEMIVLLGAKPVFVDIDPFTYTLDPNLLEAVITPKTKAILPVSLFGQCADYDTINYIANKHKLPVIEDAAQSFGATYKDRYSCNLTTIGCTSFFPTKPFGCYGDGGACFTNDDDLADALKQLRIHGQEKRYIHRSIGINSRLDSLQAGILLAKFPSLAKELEQRTYLGQLYSKLLKDKVKTPYIPSYNTSVYAQYTIEVEHRDLVQENLVELGILTNVHYRIPLHLQPAFAHLEWVGEFPVAEKAAQKVLSLPMYPYMGEDTVHRVVSAVIQAVKNSNIAR